MRNSAAEKSRITRNLPALGHWLPLLFLLVVAPSVGFSMLPRHILLGNRALASSSCRHFILAPLRDSGAEETSIMIPTNQQLVERRLEVARAKKQARARSLQEIHERNLQLKRLLHANATTNYTVPMLYAVKVSVCDELRQELHLNGREKRGRIFINTDSEGCQTVKGLRQELHSFFRCLKKGTYILQACLPVVGEDGSIQSPQHDLSEPSNKVDMWGIESDQDVLKTFASADAFFQENNNTFLKRPSILIHVSKDPNAPPPPPPPAYLQGMLDPKESPSMTMLSFYAFPPGGIPDPDEFALYLRRQWKPFDALGRVYVANEGVNAQMSVPTNVLESFIECCKSIPELSVHMENGVNVDPVPLSKEEFAIAGVAVNGKPSPPFRNLHIRVRRQIVADGLDKPLKWQEAGYDMPPLEWHQKLKEAREKRESGQEDVPLIFDCRNSYETDVGRFEGAEPLDTENFRETWDVLKERLEETPKDAPILTYCTGGIRCVKVGAYLTQELGFTNVSRLAGGIIAYDRTLNEEAAQEEPMFKGTNFVFDGRLSRPITEESFGQCVTCGEEASLVSNCLNDNCHKRIIQCEKCRSAYHGTCSEACKNRVETLALHSRARGTDESIASDISESSSQTSFATIEAGHSSPPPSLYREMEFNTKHYMASGAHMVSGASQGRWLTQLASMTREGRILELGTFTGYGTACFLEGSANAAHAMGHHDAERGGGDRRGGPFVMTMERDDRARDLAIAHLNVMCQLGLGEDAAEAACALRAASSSEVTSNDQDSVFMTYNGVAGCEILRVTDALATVEEMARGQGSVRTAPFDMVFVDADKTRLLEYVEACLSSDLVLKKGGLIVVDNVLWKGLVLEAKNNGRRPAVDDNDDETSQGNHHELRKNRRARKLASKMHHFNSEIIKDDRVEVVVLPMRDGLSVIRKRCLS